MWWGEVGRILREAEGLLGFLCPMVDSLENFLGDGDKGLDKGQSLFRILEDVGCYSVVYDECRFSGGRVGGEGLGSHCQCLALREEALKAKGMAGSVVLQAAGAPLCQGGVQEAGSTLNSLGFVSVPSIVLDNEETPQCPDPSWELGFPEPSSHVSGPGWSSEGHGPPSIHDRMKPESREHATGP